jgi:hypothetical protein
MSVLKVFDISKSQYVVDPDAKRLVERVWGGSRAALWVYTTYSLSDEMPFRSWLLREIRAAGVSVADDDEQFVTEDLPGLLRSWAAQDAVRDAHLFDGDEVGPYWGTLSYDSVGDRFEIRDYSACIKQGAIGPRRYQVLAETVTCDMLADRLAAQWAEMEGEING